MPKFTPKPTKVKSTLCDELNSIDNQIFEIVCSMAELQEWLELDHDVVLETELDELQCDIAKLFSRRKGIKKQLDQIQKKGR